MSRRLLLADDSVTIQKVIEITLSDKDYILSIASNGDEAMRMAISERPDLILADVFMPGKNGYELCQDIRNNADLKDVPVLLLAGTFEPFDQDKARSVGANDWIVKPFSSQGLIDKVEELLAQKPAEETWSAVPSQAPGDQDILQALEEVVATQAVVDTPVAPEPVVSEPVTASFVDPIQPFEAPTATAVELEPLDLSVAEPDAAVAESSEQSLDPFSSPQPIEVELPPLADFTLDDEPFGATDSVESFSFDDPSEDETPPEVAPVVIEPVAGVIPEAVESFSFDSAPEVAESAIVAEPAAQPAELPSLGDFKLPDEQPELDVQPEPVVTSAAGVIELNEADVAEEGAYGAVPERVEKRIAFLSDEQLMEIVDRVAGAVIERLAAPMLEQVVWEVVPDLAESMVREEMAKIKPEA